MIETTDTFSTGTLQAWTRLPWPIRLAAAIAAVIAISWLMATLINAPTGVAAIPQAAAGPVPMRDPSVPDAGQALSAHEREQQLVAIPTF